VSELVRRVSDQVRRDGLIVTCRLRLGGTTNGGPPAPNNGGAFAEGEGAFVLPGDAGVSWDRRVRQSGCAAKWLLCE